MKHVKLFEEFSEIVGDEGFIFSFDLTQGFPELYTGNDAEEGTSTLSVFLLNPPYPEDTDEAFTHFDPSYYEEGNSKIKLIYAWEDSLHYGGENTIYMGLTDVTKEGVLAWFRDLLQDQSRDYLSA